MPILWRYLIRSYVQVFFLTVVAFIAILLTSRLEEIAHFASFGAELKLIALFALLQIPYILPIAIPIACLVASILLMQRLSIDHELTSVRSAGISLREITAPLIITSLIMALLNFYIVSELATLSHLKTNQLKSELRSINPLLLLHNKHLARAKGIYYDVLGPSKMGQIATDVVIAIPNMRQKHLDLLLAKRLDADDEKVTATGLSLLSTFKPHAPTSMNVEAAVKERVLGPTVKEEAVATSLKPNSRFDNLLLETIATSSSTVQDFALLAQKTVSSITADHLNLSLLLLRLRKDQELLARPADESILQTIQVSTVKALHKSIRLGYSEIARRLSAALAPFSFTLLGLAFGMNISRSPKPFKLFFPIGLAAFYLISFFAAKALASQVTLSYGLYLVPHLLIALASSWKIARINHGVA